MCYDALTNNVYTSRSTNQLIMASRAPPNTGNMVKKALRTEYLAISLPKPLGLGFSRGPKEECRVKDVKAGANGEKSGIEVGDIIMAVNGDVCPTYNEALDLAKAAEDVELIISREARTRVILSRARNVDTRGDKHTMYEIAMRGKTGERWKMLKRYSDFEQLHAEFGKFKGLQLPGNKSWFGGGGWTDEPEMILRLHGLNGYLNDLVTPENLKEPVLKNFLKKDQPEVPQRRIIKTWDGEWSPAFFAIPPPLK